MVAAGDLMSINGRLSAIWYRAPGVCSGRL